MSSASRFNSTSSPSSTMIAALTKRCCICFGLLVLLISSRPTSAVPLSAQDIPPVPVVTGQATGNGGVNVPAPEPEPSVKVPSGQVYNPDEALAPAALAPFGSGGSNWQQDPISSQAVVPLFVSKSSSQNEPNKKPGIVATVVEPVAPATGFDPLSGLGLSVIGGTLVLLLGAGWYVVKRQ